MNGRGEPDWQPISMLATIASLIDGGLSDAREHYAMLLKARPKPYVLDGATIVRTKRVNAEGLVQQMLKAHAVGQRDPASATLEHARVHLETNPRRDLVKRRERRQLQRRLHEHLQRDVDQIRRVVLDLRR